jgi:O-glycosyl hydrolase
MRTRRATFPLMVLNAAAALAACRGSDPVVPAPAAGDEVVFEVDNGVVRQTVDGFGSTTVSLVYPNGDHLGAYRQAAIAAAYGTVGISLGTVSVGVVEAPANATDVYGQRGNDNSSPAVMNPSGFNFAGSDDMLQRVLVPARAFGYAGLQLGPLVSLAGPLDWLKPIRASDYERYLDEVAEHVLAVMQHWRDAYGLTPRLVHLFNEPTTGALELQSTSIHEMVDIVKRVGARLRGAGFADVKFIVPNEETISRSLEAARAILEDAVARQYVGVIGYHAYPYGSAYSSPRRILTTSGNGTPDASARAELEELKALSQQYNVPVWLTEVSEGPGNQDYAFDAIENVLARAVHIHDNFEYAGASAFFGMMTIWDSRTFAEHLAGRSFTFLSDMNCIVLADVSTGTIYITGTGYAISHYAKWLGPGAVVISATGTHAVPIVTAFRDVAANRIVVVVVNTASASQPFRIVLRGAAARGQISGALSSAAGRAQSIAPFAPDSESEVRFTSPAKSVVTLAVPLR